MKDARGYWDERYLSGDVGFQNLLGDRPSTAVVKFVDYLQKNNLPVSGKLLELGSGLGRNTNWLAQKGFDVLGVDISPVAIAKSVERAKSLGVYVNYRVLDISEMWPFEDNSMDYIVDTYTFPLISSQQAEIYASELKRVLKFGGRFLLCTNDRTEDAQSQKLIRENPGSEPNSYIIPDIRLTERTFTLEEIAEQFRPLSIESKELGFSPTKFNNKVYDRYFWWVVLRKDKTQDEIRRHLARKEKEYRKSRREFGHWALDNGLGSYR